MGLRIYYNGHDLARESLVTEADAVLGYVCVIDRAERYPGGGKALAGRHGFYGRRLWGDVSIVYGRSEARQWSGVDGVRY
jgi:hypothetical protein